MANTSGNAFCLTVLCPVKNDTVGGRSCAALTRDIIEHLPTGLESPLAKVPQTYFGRFYLLNDVFYQGGQHERDHLKSHYLVFTANFFGDLDRWLEGFWSSASDDAQYIWQHCVSFDTVASAEGFRDYIKKCQVDAALFFNGSNDHALEDQLKALFLKQEFSRFAVANQGLAPADLREEFRAFLQRVEPQNLAGPSFVPGAETV
ncbi:Uncharacterised protein [BD1-7 clade bacterium]|uniref:Uncharacterized protein n=1 Tax=BD1-7 clade bacterium TaxID=2029982 RepID=A0A5S9QXD2_9GAMM|nr:Uncharacterised protein [BD1-7 clade bacterium]